MTTSFSVLGVPFRLETNSPEILELAGATYEPVRDAAASAPPTLAVRILAAPEQGGRPLRPPIVGLPEWHRLELDLGAGTGRADALRGEAEARISRDAVRAPGFREWVLDHLVLFLVTNVDRTPLHVGGIVRHGKALLLAGPSGRGKSSLTYAAMLDGCQVLADDAVYLEKRAGRRLWAVARDIHLPVEATRHFPELVGAPRHVRADGRTKIAVPVPPPARAAVPWTGPVGLCFLGDADAPGRPERLARAAAEREMREALQGGFTRFERAAEDCVPTLIEGGCWRLPVTAAPRELVRRLDDMFSED